MKQQNCKLITIVISTHCTVIDFFLELSNIRQVFRVLRIHRNDVISVVDPDLQIWGGGGGVGVIQDPEIRVGGLKKNFFWHLWASVWSKNKGGVAPPPGSSTAYSNSNSSVVKIA